MSTADVIVMQYLTAYGLPLISILGLLLLISKNLSHMKNKLLSKIIIKFDGTCEKLMVEEKKLLFKPLQDMVSADWKLKNKGLIRILEIGFRTGENVKYYPKNCHLVIVDRNVHIHSYLKNKPYLTSDVNVERVIVSCGQNLKCIPDCSVDAVVGTFILCSSVEVDLLLKEIRRILVPGGQYFFIEHTTEPRDTFLYKIQNVLTLTKLWPNIFDGCHLNRNPEKAIKCADFSDVICHFVTVTDKLRNMFSRLMRTHLIGRAVK